MKISGFTKIAAITLAFAFFAIPVYTASAGVGSFLASIITKDTSYSASYSDNSQSIDLLQPAINPNPAPVGGADITITDGSTLDPEAGPIGAGPNLSEEFSQDQISLYVVKEGDTLSQIGTMFDVSVNTIIWANDIKKGVIRPGQRLVILPISGINHRVEKGDTLSTIIKEYGADAKEVMEYNGLTEDSKLSIGDVVVVPDGVLESSPSSSNSRPAQISKTVSNYSSISGYYARPVVGGRRTQGIHGYNGVDLVASASDQSIYASAAGKVIISRASGWNGGYGKYIVIRHNNGTQTLYSHLSKTYVSAGQWVSQGESIGFQGSTGRSTGPHLHFEVRGAKNPF